MNVASQTPTLPASSLQLPTDSFGSKIQQVQICKASCRTVRLYLPGILSENPLTLMSVHELGKAIELFSATRSPLALARVAASPRAAQTAIKRPQRAM